MKMDWAFATVCLAAITGTTIGYVTKRYFDALESYDDSEYMDSVELPAEMRRDTAMILASPRYDEREA